MVNTHSRLKAVEEIHYGLGTGASAGYRMEIGIAHTERS